KRSAAAKGSQNGQDGHRAARDWTYVSQSVNRCYRGARTAPLYLLRDIGAAAFITQEIGLGGELLRGIAQNDGRIGGGNRDSERAHLCASARGQRQENESAIRSQKGQHSSTLG